MNSIKLKSGLKGALCMLTAAALGLSMFSTALADTTRSVPVITVDAKTARGEVNDYLRGANHRFGHGGFGMYDRDNDKVYDDFQQKTKDAKLGVVRYPGGTIANLFKWKDTIGPKSGRRNVVLANTLESDFPDYGVDEHMRYCEAIGAKASYMVAEASETPQDAADLVEYLNTPNDGSNPGGGVDWAAVRAKNGHPEPYGVTYFELGNEMYLENQRLWLSQPSAEGANKSDTEKYALGDTVRITNGVARKYGTWSDNQSSGQGGQKFYSRWAPVVKDSQTVYVGGEAWEEVSDLSKADAFDKVYAFNPDTGEIAFGDGVHGAIPAKSSKITMNFLHEHAGFQEYYEAMKAIDPSIKLVACMENTYQYVPKDKCDGIVYHDYINLPGTTNTNDKLHDNFMTVSDDIVNMMRANVSDVRTKSGRNDAIAAVTEFGNIPVPDVPPVSDNIHRDEARTLSRGLAFANIYIGAMSSGVEMAIHQGYTAYSFGGGPNLAGAGNIFNSLYAPDPDDPSKTIESSMALSYKLLGNNTGNVKLETFIEKNPQVKNSTSYEALRAVTTRDSATGDLYLIVVNRDPYQDITSAVNLLGYTIKGDAAVTTLNGAEYMSCNTPEHPDDVTLTSSSVTMGVGGGSFSYQFPAHSVTAVKLGGETNSTPVWTENFAKRDFQAVAPGNMPGYLKVNAGAAAVQEDPAQKSNKALRITRKGANSQVFGYLSGEKFADLAGEAKTYDSLIRVNFRAKAAQTTGRLNISVLGNNGVKAANISFDNTGFIKNNGSNHAVYEANKWYDFEILLDQAAREYRLYVNGECLGNARRAYNNETAALQSIIFDAENADGEFYVDDLIIRSADGEVTPAITQSEPAAVSTRAGVAPVLPKTVNLVYNTGLKEEKPVIWEAVKPEQYARAGIFTVAGSIEGSTLKARVVVTVTAPVSVKEVAIETKAGTAPVLPDSVRVIYSDGSAEEALVTWEEVTPEQYAQAGVFEVSGAVEGCALMAKAVVKVSEPPPEPAVLQSIAVKTKPDKTVYTVGDKLETKGLTLSVKYSDGTEKSIDSGFTARADLTKLGTATVTVTYEGKTVSFTVTVKEKEPQSSSEPSEPAKPEEPESSGPVGPGSASEPEEPEKPVPDPEEPGQDQPSSQGKAPGGSNNPQTGAALGAVLGIVLLGSAAAGSAILLRRKEHERTRG